MCVLLKTKRFQFIIPYAEAIRKQLFISVKNDKPFLSSETKFLGQLCIDLSSVEINLVVRSKWYKLKLKFYGIAIY